MEKGKEKKLWKSVQAFCIECMGGGKEGKAEVKNCLVTDCWLFNYRLGPLEGEKLKIVPKLKNKIKELKEG